MSRRPSGSMKSTLRFRGRRSAQLPLRPLLLRTMSLFCVRFHRLRHLARHLTTDFERRVQPHGSLQNFVFSVHVSAGVNCTRPPTKKRPESVRELNFYTLRLWRMNVRVEDPICDV